MKTDITTAVISAIVGIIVAYLITSNFVLGGSIKPISIKTLPTTVSTNLDEPNPEVFNYRALNPTVEVYIGCQTYDASGSCADEGVVEGE